MKLIISDRDVRDGFLRCECDTKYASDTFKLLESEGCRVCGKEFMRVTGAELAAAALRQLGPISPEKAAMIVSIFMR